MTPIVDNLRSLGRKRLTILGATGAGLTLALLLGLNTVMAPTFAPLYSELSPAGAQDVVSTLEQAGFKVDLSGGGSVVSVPQEDVARARMVLASKGLPDSGTPGWELFDNATGLGMNTFMQRVNRLRALEGELARSIQTIEGIDAARVHLVLPEREAFSRTRPDPSASVIVRGRASYEISRRQGMAIRALIAAAVPDLSPSRVTVLSASGETILAEDGDSPAEVTLQSTRAAIEEKMARSISEILTARVGAGNARVQVTVDLSNEREVVVSESYNPAQQVVRSTETREETVEGRENASGEVSVADNLPDALAGGTATTPQSQNTRATTGEIVNYEIGTTKSEIVREPGDIQRVSVAVLVNGIYNVQPDGSVEYAERPTEELDRLQQLVQSAIGFDPNRGDTVSVDSLRFVDYSMDVGEPARESISDVLSANIMSILRGLFALAVVALVVLFGARPMLDRLFPKDPTEEEDEAEPALAAPPDSPAIAAPEQAAAKAIAAAPRVGVPVYTGSVLDPLGAGEEELVTLASVQGGIHRRRLASVGTIVEGEPDESLKVLRTWLAQGA